MRPGALTCAQHVERAANHLRVGAALHEAMDEEWAGVCYFYGAYHLVRAALITDPIFDDLDQLKKVNADLIPDDRWSDKHVVRKGASGFGVNQLVHHLYPAIQAPYHGLHGVSVEVRYKGGTSVPVADSRADFDDVRKYLSSGLSRLDTLSTELATRLTA